MDETELDCDLTLGDGICDPSFNVAKYNYDEGDCCASTCLQPECGRRLNNVETVFGVSSKPEISFPNCENSVMMPITIQLHNITSSRDPKFDQEPPDYNSLDDYGDESESEWRNKTPNEAYFALDCNGINVLTAYISKKMMKNHEKVMVDDGATCNLVVRNSGLNETDNWETMTKTDAIWIVEYSVYHPITIGNKFEQLEIIGKKSSHDEQYESFRRIPQLYFRKLENYVNPTFIYTALDSPNKAIRWLLDEHEGQDSSNWKQEFFIERFALATLFISLQGDDLLSLNSNQCTWETVTCAGGSITQIDTRGKLLAGLIPTEVALLSSLKALRSGKAPETGSD